MKLQKCGTIFEMCEIRIVANYILLHTASILIAHNHPSGNPKPSTEDRNITQRLKEAGDIIGIKILDHIIIGNDEYYSLK